MGPPRMIDPTTHRTMSERSYHGDEMGSYLALLLEKLTTASLIGAVSKTGGYCVLVSLMGF